MTKLKDWTEDDIQKLRFMRDHANQLPAASEFRNFYDCWLKTGMLVAGNIRNPGHYVTSNLIQDTYKNFIVRRLTGRQP